MSIFLSFCDVRWDLQFFDDRFNLDDYVLDVIQTPVDILLDKLSRFFCGLAEDMQIE